MAKTEQMGHYNIAFLRVMYKGPRKLGIHMSPRHNWQMCRKNDLKNQPTPTAIEPDRLPGHKTRLNSRNLGVHPGNTVTPYRVRARRVDRSPRGISRVLKMRKASP
jgi:hypothetical protein